MAPLVDHHPLQLAGITGHYGPSRRTAVISFGSTGRGAIHALLGQGYTDITLLTQRPYYTVQAPIPSVNHYQYQRKAPDSSDTVVRLEHQKTVPMAAELVRHYIIVNCILQDSDQPLNFLAQEHARRLKPGALIIDISCDTEMGFEFARPTSFEHPTFPVGENATYYAVDHTPSFLWNTSSHEISVALQPYMEIVLGGEEAWERDATIRNAIEIKAGVVLNRKILKYQNRSDEYPHRTK